MNQNIIYHPINIHNFMYQLKINLNGKQTKYYSPNAISPQSTKRDGHSGKGESFRL
jgi:hypothetical protein